MPINSQVYYQQVLSLSLEDRSPGYQDLVSNHNPLTAMLKQKGAWSTYNGPRIRQRLQIAKPAGQWYSGYDLLDAPPLELFNDAYYTPKMLAVPISLNMEEILNNGGEAQLVDTMSAYLDTAEKAAMDAWDVGVYSDGTANSGKQMGGLAVAIPVVNNTGTYGGIDRSAFSIWRTGVYDANAAFTGITQVTSTTIRPILNQIYMQRTRGKDYANLLVMSPEHYNAYDQSIVAQQRITSDNPSMLGSLGFTTMEYVGAGKRVPIVMAGGYGSNMPANTTFGINLDSFKVRYNEDRNFDKLFEGDGQRPINQDAIAQYIGWMGELTMTNPLFNWRLYDSNPAA